VFVGLHVQQQREGETKNYRTMAEAKSLKV